LTDSYPFLPPSLLQIVLCSATFSPETTKAAQEIFPRDAFVLITLQDHELNRANIQQVGREEGRERRGRKFVEYLHDS